MSRVGILQVNPQTFWKSGGGEVHASKYLSLLQDFGYQAERFNFSHPEAYEVVHIFGSNPQLFEWGRYAVKEGIKVVCTPILFPSLNTLKYQAFLKIGKLLPFPTSLEMRRQILQDCHHLIANTEAEKDYLVKAYGIENDKIAVIGTGVDASELSWKTDGNYPGLPEKYILMVGRVTPLKKQAEVMKILENSDLNLVICGPPDLYESSYLKEIRTLLEKHKDRYFWIEGLPPGSNDLKNLYANAVCHLLFSETDVAPLVNMEAAALGTLVCSRPHITVREIMGDLASYAVESNLIAQLREIHNLTEDERSNRIKKLQSHIRNNHTWEKIVEETAKIYDKLLQKSS